MAKILIIDDSRFARLKMSANLKDAGFEVIEAVEGAEGFEITQKEKPDIVICDLLMPVMDGFGYLRKIKEEGLDVPVLILTSDIQEKTRARAMELGAADLVNKPPKYEDVIEKINALVSDGKC